MIQSVQSTTQVVNDSQAKQAKPIETAETTPKQIGDKADTKEVKKGIIPTLKGIGAGALGGAIATGAGSVPLLLAFSGEEAKYVGAIAMGMAVFAVVPGAIVGAVTANYTDNKKVALAAGAAAGVAMATAYTALTRDHSGWNIVIGGLAGAGAGFAGAKVASK